MDIFQYRTTYQYSFEHGWIWPPGKRYFLGSPSPLCKLRSPDLGIWEKKNLLFFHNTGTDILIRVYFFEIQEKQVSRFCTSCLYNFKPDAILPKNALVCVFAKIFKYCPDTMYEDFRNEYTDSTSKRKEIKSNVGCVYKELKYCDDNIDANNKNN